MTPDKDENTTDPLLFGAGPREALLAVEHIEDPGDRDQMRLFFRRGAATAVENDDFEPFLFADHAILAECPVRCRVRKLPGQGALNALASFPTWKACLDAKTWLARTTRIAPGVGAAPYFHINDPVQQYLTSSGMTLFVGMPFNDLRRLFLDIECVTTEGYEFCNPEREEDRIVAIALADNTGWAEVLWEPGGTGGASEKKLIERFVAVVRERDPDVIEGYNIFNFDLPYIAERAKRHRVKLALGRDGSRPLCRQSRFGVAERTISYRRFDVFGRHVVDVLFLVHAYDVTHRSLDGFGLKEAAVHFGVAQPDRTYVDGNEIGKTFRADPERVVRYARDDVLETRALSDLLSMTGFVQTQMLPFSYQNACVRGNGTKIDALMVREYLRQGRALPMPGMPREFAGGYTDMFVQGMVRNVHHCDVRSLYPSLMLERKIAPRNDELGVFLRLLASFKAMRMQARDKARKSDGTSRTYYDAMQSAFKVLINSFYGYLGFGQGRFNDFDAAGQVAADGRELLGNMIAWLRKRGAVPVEIDTDGIYFVPPENLSAKAAEDFRREFARSLPPGIEVEFDGEYASMYSYKMKNYALLAANGEMMIKGAALKSRGLERFQRNFLREFIRLKLEGREDMIPALKKRYERAILDKEWPIDRFAKSENLQDAPSTYLAKRSKARRPKSAAYELALKSGREYRAGDQVSYYVTGVKKTVKVHESAKLASEWNPLERDENIPYYLAKLDALYDKFTSAGSGGEKDGEENQTGSQDE